MVHQRVKLLKHGSKARTAKARKVAEILPLASPVYVVGHVETVEAAGGWLELISRLNVCQANDGVWLELITGLNVCQTNDGFWLELITGLDVGQSNDVVGGDGTCGEESGCDSEELHFEIGTTWRI